MRRWDTYYSSRLMDTLKIACFLTAYIVSGCLIFAEQPHYFFPDTQYHEAGQKVGDLPPYLPPSVKHDCRGFDLAFVEFDQRGDFWNREQLGAASRKITERGEPVLLVEYVHGWHNNANEVDPRVDPDASIRDVEKFKDLLGLLAQSPYVQLF